MNKLSILNRIQELYDKNENVIEYLKESNGKTTNSMEDIMISYDFQAGSYVKEYKKNCDWKKYFINKMSTFIVENDIRGGVLEAGVGEATTLVPLLEKTKNQFNKIYGFDISWSRIKVARNFVNENRVANINLFVGDLFCMPFQDNSIDLVYTCHAIEPNGGQEKTILKELYRVSRKYLILLEPAYELAQEEAKQRMLKHGYVTHLYQSAIELGYNVVEYSLYGVNANPLNPTGFLVIEKKVENENQESALCCPLTKTCLELIDGTYYSKESLLAYPVVGGIPCLTKENAVVATKFIV